ncbi:DUF4034 domain-containing protein [Streptomyces albireticuli]|uniref:Uncharacterized protein n=1 Tax=Streptomyces albireticuli TaxID=1940 RepID=A0A2A2DET1_9ACTN|nr:DUF4034 domain-containing protein [Streptomyces albireticuli]MCD9194775.1 DUF4034 domain-containing protein [Streptomyces albireticuli]PAU50001.1 hypothetical protein CK936_04945 [Streptomyces albireticuli]
MSGIIPLTILVVMLCFWLRSRRRAKRAEGIASEIGAGLLPAERQNTDRAAPDPEAEAVLAALSRGDWLPAAQALAAAGTDWERRSYLVGIVAARAADDDTWLRAWQAARPGDPDAAVVHADAKVSLAWQIRGGAWAKDTSAERFEGFHRVLNEAREDFARAEALAHPGDPTPYLLQIPLYMGLGAPHEALHGLWAEVTKRAPYHYEAHWYALQFWSAKWRGSKDLARDFAAQAAATAPPGSLLTMFPLVSWYEHNDDEAPAEAYGWPEMTALTDAALADVAMARPGHPRIAEVRHLLAYCLTKQGRYEAALEQFRMVDGHVEALPWRYYGDPAEFYCHVRDVALKGAAAARIAG